MAKQSSGTGTIVMLALAGILGVAAYAGNEWLKYQRADYSVLLNNPEQFLQAVQGDADAQYEVGQFYSQNGKDTEALYWLNKAAEQNNGNALSYAGIAYLEGKGAVKNPQKACDYLEKAYQILKSPQAASNAAICLGDNLPSPVQAYPYYKTAAKAGDANALYQIGRMYMRGEGMPKNIPVAIHYFREAAQRNNALAFYSLGKIYMDGDGVPRNTVAAYLMMKAAQAKASGSDQNLLGNFGIQRKISDLELSFSAEQRAKRGETETYVKSHSGKEILNTLDSIIPYSSPPSIPD